MRAYSQDLRDRVLGALERGERLCDIARRYEVSRMWVYQVRKRFAQTGERCSRQVGGHNVSRLAPWEGTIRDWIAAEPDLTLAQLCEHLDSHGVSIKSSALWHQLNKWRLSFKKNPARQRTRARGRAPGTPSLATGTSRAGCPASGIS